MRLLLLIAAIFLVLFLFIASVAPFKNSLFSGLFPKYSSHASGNGSVSLLPSVIASVGQTFTTPIMIDTGGTAIVGADISINFDKSALELTNITVYPQPQSLLDIIPGEISSQQPFPAKTQFISNANSGGNIEFSILTLGPNTSFTGILNQSNPLAVLQFKVLNVSPTQVTFNHTLGSTADTNLVSIDSEEVIATVTNMSVNGPPVTYPEISPNPSPKAGDLDGDNIIGIFDYNQLLTDFGKTGSNLIADLDKDGAVGIFDYNILLTNFGK